MPDAVKLVIVFGATGGAYAGGFCLRYRRRARLGSEVVMFLGCLLYGVGIWQVAQIFHVQAHYPDGVWLWAVGVLLFALCLETPLLHLLLVSLLALWAGMEVINFSQLGAWLFGRWPMVPNGAFSLPLLALPGLVWAYRKKSVTTVGLYVLLLAWWIVLQPIAWRWEMTTVYFIGVIGGLFLLIAQAHRLGSPFAVPYRLFGVLMLAGVLIPLSYYEFNHDFNDWYFRRGDLSISGLVAGPLMVLLAMGILTAIVTLRPDPARRKPIPQAFLDLLRGQWVPVAIVVLMTVLPLMNTVLYGTYMLGEWAALICTITANVAMIAVAVWLMRVGLVEDRARPFAAGVLYFLLWSILRYFDLFADFAGMLGASLMFLLCGVGLFAVAVYWQRRKEVRHV